jgi:hypothetical protein
MPFIRRTWTITFTPWEQRAFLTPPVYSSGHDSFMIE